MLKTTIPKLIFVLAFLFPFISNAYNGSNANLNGLYQLNPISKTSEPFTYLYKEMGLTVYFNETKVSYVTSAIKGKSQVVGQRIDLIHKNQLEGTILSHEGNVKTNNTISIDGVLYELSAIESLSYKNIYQNIDLKYFVNNDGKLTYHYFLGENANPEDIKLNVEGAEHLSLLENGDLKIDNVAGDLTVSTPITFEGDFEKEVESNYLITSTNTLGFSIKNYSKEQAYVIDPIVNFSTYFGGSDSEIGESITIDDSSNVYVIGHSSSNNFPTTTGAFQTSRAALEDVVIFKFDSLGNLKWSTFYGGNDEDLGQAIAVSNSGKVFVSGFTKSLNLPGTFNTQPGNGSAFIAVFDNNGSLINARYLGGNSRDEARDIVTIGDTVYVTGFTSSINFPVAGIGLATINSGGEDAFLTALNDTAGTIWSQYLGGSTGDRGRTITTDSQNNIIIAGETESTNFPLLLANQNSNNGLDDGFIAKYTVTGIRILSTYYGGNSTDVINDIVSDNLNNIYVVGTTRSTDLPLPATGNSFQNSFGGGLLDAFITKFNQNGVPQWSTYYGDTASDEGFALSINASANLVVTGQTNSVNFPIDSSSALQVSKGVEFDAYVLQFDSSGNRNYASFLGGNQNDFGKSVAYEPSQSRYIILGNTRSTDFPVSPLAFQQNNAGDNDIFIYISCGLIPNNTISVPANDTLNYCQNDAITTVIGSTPTGGSGNYTYQYQILTNGSFTDISGANSKNYAIDTSKLSLGLNTLRRIVTDGLCTDTSNIYVVNYLAAPVANFSFDTLCINDNIQFTNLTTIDGSDTISTYAWTFGDGNTSSMENPTNSYNAAGTFTINLNATAENGCSDAASKNITVNQNPTANFSFVTECNNDTVQFTNTSTNVSIQNYSWSFGDGNASTDENPRNIYVSSGVYNVSLIVGNVLGCNDTISKTVGLDSSITANFGTSTNRCVDSTVTFSDSSMSFSGINSWNWDFGNGTTSTQPNPTATYNSSGDFPVKLIVTSVTGCVDSITKTITIGIPPTADFTFSTNCVNQPTQFTDASTSTSGAITNWFWNFGDGNFSGDQNPTNVYPSTNSFNVTLSAVTENGCVNTITKSVQINDKPTVDAGNDITTFEGFTVQLLANSSAAGTYLWSPSATLSNPNIANPTADPQDSTLYTVRLTDSNGCFGEDSVFVNVNPKFFIASAFTPNGDGDNDNFIIEGIDRFPNHSVIIFNRWGSELFSASKTYAKSPWDGTFDGELMPIGAYYYIIDLGDGTDLFKGTITILR